MPKWVSTLWFPVAWLYHSNWHFGHCLSLQGLFSQDSCDSHFQDSTFLLPDNTSVISSAVSPPFFWLVNLETSRTLPQVSFSLSTHSSSVARAYVAINNTVMWVTPVLPMDTDAMLFFSPLGNSSVLFFTFFPYSTQKPRWLPENGQTVSRTENPGSLLQYLSSNLISSSLSLLILPHPH